MVAPTIPAGKGGVGDNASLFPEDSLSFPWVFNPQNSWFEYRCWVEVNLDAGMALHKPLPQKNPIVDHLATTYLGDANFDTATPASGVNIASYSDATDVIQRMATSTYRFTLRGWGMRAGYQIPIPGLKTVGGVPAVPGEIQRGYNVIVGNLAGIPLWFATWTLEYLIAKAPRGSPGLENRPGSVAAPVPANPALHIRPDAKLPLSVQLPWTVIDSRNDEPLLASLTPPPLRARLR